MSVVGALIAFGLIGYLAWRITKSDDKPKGGAPKKDYPPSKEK